MTGVTVTRAVQADRNRVWEAFTDGAELARWFWPASFGAEATIDLQPGGAWHIRAAQPSMGVSGEVVGIDAPARFVHTWRWDGEDAETLVTVTLASAGAAKTTLTVTHEGFDDEQTAVEHETGWNDCLDRLPLALQG